MDSQIRKWKKKREREKREREDGFKRLDVTRRHPFVSLLIPFATTIKQPNETIARASRENLLREGRERIFNSSLAWTIVHSQGMSNSRKAGVTSRLQPPQHDWPNGPPPPKHPLLERNYPLSLSPSTPLLPFGPARRCTLFLSLSLSLCRAHVHHSLRHAVPVTSAILANLLSTWNERDREQNKGEMVGSSSENFRDKKRSTIRFLAASRGATIFHSRSAAERRVKSVPPPRRRH